MENIITLIVFIIMIVSIVNKFKAKDKKGKKTGQGGGLMAKINAILQEVQENIEQQKKKDTDGYSGWDQVMDEDEQQKVRQHYPEPDSVKIRQHYPEPEALDDLVLEEETPPSPPPKKIQPRQPRLTTRERKKPITAPVKPSPPDRKKARRPVLSMGRARLRKAIIWSEILGTPVGLRDPQGDRF